MHRRSTRSQRCCVTYRNLWNDHLKGGELLLEAVFQHGLKFARTLEIGSIEQNLVMAGGNRIEPSLIEQTSCFL